MSHEKLVEVCPVCGNADIYYEVGGYVGSVYHCKGCGYVGAFVVEANEEMIEKIKETYKREKRKEKKEEEEKEGEKETEDKIEEGEEEKE